MSRGRAGAARLLAVAAVLAVPGPARGAPDGLLPDWLRLDAEYRALTLYLDPLALADTEVRDAVWTEQRLRVDAGLVWPKVGGLFVQVDVLDGVLFGDNGDFGSEPEPTAGLAVTSKRPNEAAWGVGLRAGADPLDPDSYVPVLRAVRPVALNRVFADVYLPFGLLRVGRQPVAYGAGIAGHEGGRANRWGVSRFAETADRVLVATKLDQVVRVLALGADAAIDSSVDRGLILALAFDWGTQDEIVFVDDDLYQVNVLLQWLVPEASWLGAEWRDLGVSAAFVHRWHPAFATRVFALPIRVRGTVGPVSVDLQYAVAFGASREVSEGFAALTAKPPHTQDILGMGVAARVDVRVAFAELTLEVDYASGDDDPRAASDLASFAFVRDYNVGLLLFEHLLAFESARSAAVGIENLRQLEARSFPLTEVATDGRFTNAVALFPQVKLDVLDTPAHRLRVRLGALFAWPAVGAVDPVMTALAEDGREIADDAVSFHGGAPGSYYGTELDLQVEWTFAGFFTWTVEGAVLFPGDALRDRDGDAQTAFLVENRLVVAF